MKFRILTTVLALLLLLGLTGCSGARMGRTIDRAEDALENKVEQVEDAVETILQTPVPAAAAPATQPRETTPVTTAAPAPRTSAPAISREEAEKIALEHAGFTGDQIKYLHTEYEIDDGRPQYEVSFHQDRWEYDYEIDAETGAIISFEKDD